MRLIDADAAVARLNKTPNPGIYNAVTMYIDAQPTIDAVPVVRCERCVALEANAKYPTPECEPYYCHELERNVYTIGFCGYGHTG